MIVVALALVFLVIGMGAISSLAFAWQWIIGSPTQLSAWILLISVSAVLLRLLVYVKRRVPEPLNQAGKRWILPALSLIGAVGYAGYWMLQEVKKLPQGAWDAIAIWNVHARFLYRGSGGLWRHLFDAELRRGQNDYPLLLPGLISAAWMTTGAERPWLPAVLALAFAALSIGILCSAVSALVGLERGLLAGLVLLATPSYLHASTSQMADVATGLYILTTIVLVQFAEAWPHVKRPLLILAGLSAGFAAWTKQEGLLFLAAFLGSQVAGYALRQAWPELRRNMLMITLGLAPMLLLIFSFKVLLAPTNSTMSVEILQQTLDRPPTTDRYRVVLHGFWDQAKGFGGTWHSGGIHPGVLVALYLVLQAAPIRRISPGTLSLLLLIGFMICGYFLVYMTTPLGAYDAFITNSLNRLLLQIWPTCLFILAVAPWSAEFADPLTAPRLNSSAG